MVLRENKVILERKVDKDCQELQGHKDQWLVRKLDKIFVVSLKLRKCFNRDLQALEVSVEEKGPQDHQGYVE